MAILQSIKFVYLKIYCVASIAQFVVVVVQNGQMLFAVHIIMDIIQYY